MQRDKNGILAVAGRELGRITSRPIYLIIMLFIPLVCYAFFTSLLNQGLPAEMPVAVVDMDNSSTSRLLVRQIDASRQSNVVEKLSNYHEANAELQKGNIYAFVMIPENFQADVLSGRQPQVAFYTQNAYFVAGSLLMKDLTLTIASVSSGVNLKMRMAKGQSPDYAMAQVQPIVPDVNEMGNAWVNYSIYLSTTMLPGILQLMVLLTTIFCIGTELKNKTSREWLRVSGNSMVKSLVGKLLPYSAVFILLSIFGNVLMFKYMSFPFAGSMWQMCLASVLFVLAQQALGVFVIGLIPVMRDSLSVSAILGTLAISFSGLTFPIEGMLSGIQAWSVAFPLRHYFLIYQSQALTGAGISASWSAYLSLIAFFVLPFFILTRLKKALIRQNYPTS